MLHMYRLRARRQGGVRGRGRLRNRVARAGLAGADFDGVGTVLSERVRLVAP
ncbi:hypothetical protein GCM10010510_40640 [Streptomyces anandii JCM 4720]|nr:hypothetical protein GCM10010510_40640 [Streptomyces anandii JCM 4720]